jgi:creatinine amidohydrolase
MPATRFLPALFLLLALAAQSAVQAEPPKTVYLEELTWTELAGQLRAGATTVIVPVGGTEQSGPQIALGKHNVRVKALAGRIASELGNALVAPVLAYVPEGAIEPPVGHMRFAGTLSVPTAAFEATLEAAARSLRRHGFRDIVLIGDHGGYQKSLVAVAVRLDREWAASPVRVHALEAYYRAADQGYAELLKRRGYSDAEIGTHAGLADTALALAIDPGLVRADRLHADARPGPEDGVHGDPRRATAELGRLGADLIVARSVDAIRKGIAQR